MYGMCVPLVCNGDGAAWLCKCCANGTRWDAQAGCLLRRKTQVGLA